MLKIEIDANAIDEKFSFISQRFEQFTPKMEDELTRWQLEDMNRQQPDTEHIGNRSVGTTIQPRGKRKSRAERALERYQRRLIRRITPKPIRALRRYARIGRRPERVLLPAPIRRLRRFRRQVSRVAAGAPTAVARALGPIGRVRRIVRRAVLRADLAEALTMRMGGLARGFLSWR